MTDHAPLPELVPTRWTTLLLDLAVPTVAALLTVGFFLIAAR